MYRYSFRRCFNTCDLPDGIYERLTVMRARAAHQSAIDVEED
jgi:hypothetical protein